MREGNLRSPQDKVGVHVKEHRPGNPQQTQRCNTDHMTLHGRSPANEESP